MCLEESLELPLALLIPEDGFSSEMVRGIPAGLVDFLSPLQAAGMCRLAAQPTSIGLWTVYMHQYNVNISQFFLTIACNRIQTVHLTESNQFDFSKRVHQVLCQQNYHNPKYKL